MLKQVFYIQSGEGEIVKPQLALRIGESHCSFAITDVSTRSLRELGWYETDRSNGNYLPELFEKHKTLNQPFFRTIVGFDSADSTLVSNESSSEQARDILKLMTGVGSSSTIICEPVQELQLKNVYTVNGELYYWVRKKLGPAVYLHQYSVNSKVLKLGTEPPVVYVEFRRDDFSVLASSEGKLLLAQSFPYTNSDDVLYYLLKIGSAFSFPQDSVKIFISGLLDQQSALYNDLRQYFHTLEFRESGWNTEFPSHFFTSLNDLHLCAS